MNYKMGKEEGHILINSWYFDFENMRAYRDPEYLLKFRHWQHPLTRHEFTLHVRGNGGIGKQFKHSLVKIFDPPEHRFNDVVDEAYHSFLLEKMLLLG